MCGCHVHNERKKCDGIFFNFFLIVMKVMIRVTVVLSTVLKCLKNVTKIKENSNDHDMHLFLHLTSRTGAN